MWALTHTMPRALSGFTSSVNSANAAGETPAVVAARRQQWDKLLLLLASGADPIYKGPKDNAPSVWELCRGDAEGARILKEGTAALLSRGLGVRGAHVLSLWQASKRQRAPTARTLPLPSGTRRPSSAR